MAVRKRLTVALVVAACVVAICAVGVVVTAPRLSGWYEDVVLDNSSHGRSCAELPTEPELRDLLARNAATVDTIRSMDPDIHAVSIEIGNTQGCVDGHYLLITYSSHREREQIETLIRGTELANAPINWRNI